MEKNYITPEAVPNMTGNAGRDTYVLADYLRRLTEQLAFRLEHVECEELTDKCLRELAAALGTNTPVKKRR